MADLFTQTFLKGPWKRNVQQVLFEHEKTLLPSAQIILDQRNARQKLSEEIREIDLMMHKLKTERLQKCKLLDTVECEDHWNSIPLWQRIDCHPDLCEMDIVAACDHLQKVEIPKYNTEDNLELRISFLRNELTEDEFKCKIHQSHTIREKNKEIREVLELFVNTTIDLCKNPDLLAIESTRQHANECLVRIAESFHHKPKQIQEDFRLK